MSVSYELPVPVTVEPVPEPDKVSVPETMQEETLEADVPMDARTSTNEMSEPMVSAEVPWAPSWYVKTNFLTYPLNLTANAAVEVEVGRHFSLSVLFYFSAMNWFRYDIKFRVCGSQPEFTIS